MQQQNQARVEEMVCCSPRVCLKETHLPLAAAGNIFHRREVSIHRNVPRSVSAMAMLLRTMVKFGADASAAS